MSESGVLTAQDMLDCFEKLKEESRNPSYYYCGYCGANRSLNEPHKKLVGSNFKENECPIGMLERSLRGARR